MKACCAQAKSPPDRTFRLAVTSVAAAHAVDAGSESTTALYTSESVKAPVCVCTWPVTGEILLRGFVMGQNSAKMTYSTAGGRIVRGTREWPPEDQVLGNISGVELLDHANGRSLGDGRGQGEVDEEGEGGNWELHFGWFVRDFGLKTRRDWLMVVVGWMRMRLGCLNIRSSEEDLTVPLYMCSSTMGAVAESVQYHQKVWMTQPCGLSREDCIDRLTETKSECCQWCCLEGLRWSTHSCPLPRLWLTTSVVREDSFPHKIGHSGVMKLLMRCT